MRTLYPGVLQYDPGTKSPHPGEENRPRARRPASLERRRRASAPTVREGFRNVERSTEAFPPSQTDWLNFRSWPDDVQLRLAFNRLKERLDLVHRVQLVEFAGCDLQVQVRPGRRDSLHVPFNLQEHAHRSVGQLAELRRERVLGVGASTVLSIH